jgi:hypothetical protein
MSDAEAPVLIVAEAGVVGSTKKAAPVTLAAGSGGEGYERNGA